MDSLSYQMEALKTPLVLFIVVALLGAVAYLYMNRKREGAAAPFLPEPVKKEITQGSQGSDQGANMIAQTTIQTDTNKVSVAGPEAAYDVQPIGPGRRRKFGTGGIEIPASK